MNKALITLKERWNYDFFVSYRRKNNTWFEWKKLSEWNNNFSPNYREIIPSELVIETDLTLEENKIITEKINQSMKDKELGFYCAFTGNKSYHNHSFWEGLDKLTPKQRILAKELIAEWICGKDLYEKVDKSNFKSKRLIMCFGSKHYKTDKIKTLFDYYEYKKINSVPSKIIDKVSISSEKEITIKSNFKLVKCPLVEYALTHKLPEGNRNNLFFPNAVAILSNEQLNQLEEIQNDKIGWRNRKTKFNCTQLRGYANSIGLGKICISHLLESEKR